MFHLILRIVSLFKEIPNQYGDYDLISHNLCEKFALIDFYRLFSVNGLHIDYVHKFKEFKLLF